jgi:hypothetical protein
MLNIVVELVRKKIELNEKQIDYTYNIIFYNINYFYNKYFKFILIEILKQNIYIVI